MLKETIERLKKRILSKDTLTFLLFLLVSAIFWFVQSLDKQRITNIKVPIEYTGIPQNIRLDKTIPKELEITIKDEGITLVNYINKGIEPLVIDLKQKFDTKGVIQIPKEQIRNHISKHFYSSTSVYTFSPDSINIKYNRLSKKTVQIRLDTAVVMESQYLLSDSIKVEPKTVEIYGPKTELDSIEFIETEPIVINRLKDTTTIKSNLKIDRKNGISASVQSVDVTFDVEMFTESKREIQIVVINNQDNANIRLFPSTAQVVYNVGLSKYNKIRSKDLQLVFDYEQAKSLDNKLYKLQLINSSPYISNIRISPDYVEFLVE